MYRNTMLWLLCIILNMGMYSQSGYLQDTRDSNNLVFPMEFFVDTVNAYGESKNREFYKSRMEGDEYLNSIYSHQLLKLNEPRIYIETIKEVYRFTWFNHHKGSKNPMAFRLQKGGSCFLLHTKYIHINKNRLKHDTTIIQKKEWDSLKTKLNQIGFWNISPVERTDTVTFHGSVWILEGNNGYKYHMVHRVEGKNKDIGSICIYLLKLSGLDIEL